jgi:hypothetical protein
MAEIPVGLCQCGCGERTRVSAWNRPKLGHVKGKPVRFIPGHSAWARMGGRNYKNGRYTSAAGYVWVLSPGHPRLKGTMRYIQEHVLVVEKAMGKYLRHTADVHHVNGNKSDNRPGNLVACHDRAYHVLLHTRARALAEACEKLAEQDG